jgi:hypothetical protein
MFPDMPQAGTLAINTTKAEAFAERGFKTNAISHLVLFVFIIRGKE